MRRRRPPHPVPDVFDTFADRVDDTPDTTGSVSTRVAARSAGIGVLVVLLAGAAFVAGFGWGLDHELGLDYDPVTHQEALFWEGVAKTAYAVGAGVLLAGVALAVAAVAIGLPWVRRQRA